MTTLEEISKNTNDLKLYAVGGGSLLFVDSWYDEMIDENFTRMEQSVGAQIHPPAQKKEDGGDK